MSMDAIGEVIEVHDEKATVRTRRHTACSRCGACGHLAETSDMDVEAVNLIGAKPGDLIVLSMESGSVVQAAFLAYILPLLAFIVGLIGGHQIALRWIPGVQPEWVGVIAGFVLMVSSYVGLRSYDRRASRLGKYLPHITAYFEE